MFRHDWDIIRLVEYVRGRQMYNITIIIPWIEVSSLQSCNCDCKDEISGHETDTCNDIQLISFFVFL
jgi:hypothetical protein